MPEEDRKVEGLTEYWDDVRSKGPGPAEPVERRFAREHPGDLIIGTTREKILVRIHADGTLTYGEGYTPDSAAVEFWTAMAVRRLESEARLIQFATQEQLLARVAQADLAYEACQGRAHAEGASEHDTMMEELSRRSLEAQVHNLIEYARGLLAARPDLRPAPTPVAVAPPTPPAPATEPPPTDHLDVDRGGDR